MKNESMLKVRKRCRPLGLGIVLTFLCFSGVFAQRDVIITQANKEIRCRILDETPIRFVYAYLKDGKPYRTEIFKSLVKDFKYDYYPEDLPNADRMEKPVGYNAAASNAPNHKMPPPEKPKKVKPSINEKKAVKEKKQKTETPTVQADADTLQTIDKLIEIDKPTEEEPPAVVAATAEETPTEKQAELPTLNINPKNRFRVGVKAGIGNRFGANAETSSTYDQYREKLLRGYVLGADFAFFPKNNVGFGVVYTDFKSQNHNDDIKYWNDYTGENETGNIATKRSIKYVGPVMYLRKQLDNKTYVILGLSPGYYFYSDRGNFKTMDYVVKGNGFGGAATLGIDFLLGNDITGRDVIFSIAAGYNYGNVKTLDYGGTKGVVNLEKPLDISRLDVSVGLRFIRFPKYFRLSSY